MKLIRSGSNKSRSDELRARRNQAGHQPAARTTRNVVVPARRPVQTPPVVARTRVAGAPIARKAAPKPRRQLYYALGSTGAEVRLPAVPALRPGWRLLSGLLTVLLALAIYFVYNEPIFQIQQLNITGLKRIKTANVEKLLDLTGTPIVAFDPAQARALLEETYPELSNVSVSASLPAQVDITVTERQPVLAWKAGEQTYWADEEGFLFPPRGKAADLLVIEADSTPPISVEDTPLPGDSSASGEDEAGGEESAQADETEADPEAEEAPAKKDRIMGKKIEPSILAAAKILKTTIKTDSPLLYSAKDGLGWNDASGWRAYVGLDLSNIGLKLTVYNAVVARLNSDGIQPAMISVENVHAPFYRME